MLEPNNVYHGDCLELLLDVAPESVDMVLCDLPYGTTYCEWDGVLKNMDKFNRKSVIDLSHLWDHYKRVIKPDGAIVLFGSQPFTSVLVNSNYGMYKFAYVWQKNRAGNHVAVRYQPLKIHEDILVFSKAGVNTGCHTAIKYRPQGVIWQKQVRRRKRDVIRSGTYRYNSLKAGEYEIQGTNYPKSILQFDVEKGKRLHPTQKPVALCEYLIKTFTDEGDTVLDNCAGSGTTGVACVNTRRNFILIDLIPAFCETARQRIAAI